MTQLSVTDRAAKTRRQIELVDEQLTKEFSTLPASVVHREVATVSEGLLADARFTDHVAVLTGRFAAEHLSVREESGDGLRQRSSKTAASDGLDWDHFRDLYYPDSRRHNFEAIVAYAEFKRTAGYDAGSEAAPVKDPISTDAEPLGDWEDEGGALPDAPGGSRER
jgi:hypothetical protein